MRKLIYALALLLTLAGVLLVLATPAHAAVGGWEDEVLGQVSGLHPTLRDA